MNSEDMSEIFSKFSTMVNEGNIPDEMKSILSSLSKGSEGDNTNAESSRETVSDEAPQIDFETIMKMKKVMEAMNSNKNDPRANLLLSLKPYLKDSRKEKIDQYIKLFGMSKAVEMFGGLGGETKK